MKVKDLVNVIDDAWIKISVFDGNRSICINQRAEEDLTPWYDFEVDFVSGGQEEPDDPFSQYVLIGITI